MKPLPILKPHKRPSRFTEQGLTLLEPLVALLILAVVMTAFTPPLILAMASRVRNHRSEQALKIAQQEVDEIRHFLERNSTSGVTYYPDEPPGTDPDTGLPYASGPARKVLKPNSTTCTVSSTNTFPSAESLCTVSGNSELLIQVFRTRTQVSSTGIPISFDLGVRIYQKGAANNLANLSATTSNIQGSTNTQGGGVGVENLSRPLVAVYVPISRSDLVAPSTTGLRAICKSGAGDANQNGTIDSTELSNCDNY